MRSLTNSTALALPGCLELEQMAPAIAEARQGTRQVEVRIGVGPLRRVVPLRVLGYAVSVAEAIRNDTVAAIRQPDRIVIVSSSAKAGCHDRELALLSLAALGGSLQLAGVEVPIHLELASGAREIPESLNVVLPSSLQQWLEQAARRSGNGVDPLRYAAEHSAPSMFGDLTDGNFSPLRVTIGGATEAKFWAVRMRIRRAAIAGGLRVAPAIGLLIKSIKVPWYTPLVAEPHLYQLVHSQAEVLAALERATNPQHGGNAGLKKEARAARRLIRDPRVVEFALSLACPRSAARFLRGCNFEIGERLALVMEGLL